MSWYSLCCTILVLALEFYPDLPGWNFSYEQTTKFVLAIESAQLLAHIRGPYSPLLKCNFISGWTCPRCSLAISAYWRSVITSDAFIVVLNSREPSIWGPSVQLPNLRSFSDQMSFSLLLKSVKCSSSVKYTHSSYKDESIMQDDFDVKCTSTFCKTMKANLQLSEVFSSLSKQCLNKMAWH